MCLYYLKHDLKSSPEFKIKANILIYVNLYAFDMSMFFAISVSEISIFIYKFFYYFIDKIVAIRMAN